MPDAPAPEDRTEELDTEPVPEDRAEGRDTWPTPVAPWVPEEVLDLAALVDPFIGSDGPGNVIPGAMSPHGMVRASPDTLNEHGQVGAYEHGSTNIEGFTHTHLEGPGGSGYGYSQVLLMPTTGPLDLSPAAIRSAFSHETEEAEPGYYAVRLDDHAVRVELTAAGHAAIHRYTFDEAGPARVVFDLGHSLGRSRGGRVEIEDERTVSGFGRYNVHPLLDVVLQPRDSTGLATIYFVARASAASTERGTWQGQTERDAEPGDTLIEGAHSGAWLGFEVEAGGTVEVRVALSNISVEQARANLEADIGALSFDELRASTRRLWNERLSRVRVEGGEDELRRVFYTALYHSMSTPADHTEAGGRFATAAGGEVETFEAEGWRFHTDDWCIWDTFRTTHPLRTLIEPEGVSDVVRSYLHIYEQGGWLPKCPWNASGYSRVMIGHHAVSVIADALVKGLAGFDVDLALEAALRSADSDNENPAAGGLCGYLNLGTTPEYRDLGYVPSECDRTQSVSMTLEYAYDDFCVARIAEAAGDEEVARRLDERAQSYRAHFDADTGYMRPRDREGAFTEPFDPDDASEGNDFCEAYSGIYTWFVPHDVLGLFELLGGPEEVVARLEEHFDGGHHDPSNQPSFHIPWLYNLAGRPDLTQGRVREVALTEYRAARKGLPGNDDAGSTSAWLVFAAMGLYPIAPGSPVYQVTTPLFERTEIHLHPSFYEGSSFVVEAKDHGPDNLYIQSARLNGEALSELSIRHEQIVSGGVLELELGPAPPSE